MSGVADWGTVTVGPVTVREAYTLSASINAQTGDRSIGLSGQESLPPLTMAELRARQEDMLGLKDKLVQVSFTHKADHDGYYWVADANSELTNFTGEVSRVDWSLRLEYVGPANAVDIESRLTNVVRQNNFSLLGERWHAPAIGHQGYFTGSTLPNGSVSRTTAADGAITVYRGVPAGVSPRWGCPVASYRKGAVRFTLDGATRGAENLTVSGSGWTVDNGLVRVSPAPDGTFRVSSYDGAAWRDLTWNISVGASASGEIASFDAVTVIRNDPEAVSVRAMKSLSPGRTLADFTLRRGSRFVEARVQTSSSTTLALWLDAAQNQTSVASGGYQSSTANDANGNRVTAGSARNFTPNASGGFYVTASTSFDFYAGLVVAGGSAAAGDTATALRDQYLAAMPETTMAVKR